MNIVMSLGVPLALIPFKPAQAALRTVAVSNNSQLTAALTTVQSYFLGDLNEDLKHDLFDFALFRNFYDEAHGEGAFDRMLAGVPEPDAHCLACVLSAAYAVVVRRRPGRAIGFEGSLVNDASYAVLSFD